MCTEESSSSRLRRDSISVNKHHSDSFFFSLCLYFLSSLNAIDEEYLLSVNDTNLGDATKIATMFSRRVSYFLSVLCIGSFLEFDLVVFLYVLTDTVLYDFIPFSSTQKASFRKPNMWWYVALECCSLRRVNQVDHQSLWRLIGRNARERTGTCRASWRQHERNHFGSHWWIPVEWSWCKPWNRSTRFSRWIDQRRTGSCWNDRHCVQEWEQWSRTDSVGSRNNNCLSRTADWSDLGSWMSNLISLAHVFHRALRQDRNGELHSLSIALESDDVLLDSVYRTDRWARALPVDLRHPVVPRDLILPIIPRLADVYRNRSWTAVANGMNLPRVGQQRKEDYWQGQITSKSMSNRRSSRILLAMLLDSIENVQSEQ